ncbi:hypothetical protein N9E97_03405, partial [Planktomarina sp.]|nr:hypothetical protein [Planktomarina sp.]
MSAGIWVLDWGECNRQLLIAISLQHDLEQFLFGSKLSVETFPIDPELLDQMGCTGGSVSMTLKKRGRLIKQIVSNVFFGTCHCFLHFHLDKGNRSVTYVKVIDRLSQLIAGEKHESETRNNGRFLPPCGAYRDHHIGGIS